MTAGVSDSSLTSTQTDLCQGWAIIFIRWSDEAISKCPRAGGTVEKNLIVHKLLKM